MRHPPIRHPAIGFVVGFGVAVCLLLVVLGCPRAKSLSGTWQMWLDHGKGESVINFSGNTFVEHVSAGADFEETVLKGTYSLDGSILTLNYDLPGSGVTMSDLNHNFTERLLVSFRTYRVEWESNNLAYLSLARTDANAEVSLRFALARDGATPDDSQIRFSYRATPKSHRSGRDADGMDAWLAPPRSQGSFPGGFRGRGGTMASGPIDMSHADGGREDSSGFDTSPVPAQTNYSQENSESTNRPPASRSAESTSGESSGETESNSDTSGEATGSTAGSSTSGSATGGASSGESSDDTSGTEGTNAGGNNGSRR